jgi:hypothetical protein
VQRGLQLVILLPNAFPEHPARCFVVDRQRGCAAPLQRSAPVTLSPDAWVRVVEQVREEHHERA